MTQTTLVVCRKIDLSKLLSQEWFSLLKSHRRFERIQLTFEMGGLFSHAKCWGVPNILIDNQSTILMIETEKSYQISHNGFVYDIYRDNKRYIEVVLRGISGHFTSVFVDADKATAQAYVFRVTSQQLSKLVDDTN